MSAEQNSWLVRAMSEPSFYDHPVSGVKMIETHISWVFLAGEFAYKVKKPLNLGFLDFSTLEKRYYYCGEELRLNREFSPHIYLALTPIGGRPQAPLINSEPALEYAVKMRRFPQECQLDRMLASGQLQTCHIIAFATAMASLHQHASPASANTAYGGPDAVISPVLENFRQIRPLIEGSDREEQLAALEQWSRATCEALKPVISRRKREGFTRACHGDLHLANMAWLDDQPLLFDCIEFNESLRWIDVVNDIAFLVMDLDDREQTAFGWSFLNRYVQETGDYHGLALLNFYKTYRAMVRAKVTCLRLTQGHLGEIERNQVESLFQSYLGLAERYTHDHAVPLIVTHGLSGAGKSTFAAQLASQYGAIHLRSDIERKRLYGLAATDVSESPVDGGIYSAIAFKETYARLRELAAVLLRAGIPVIVDATFIKKQQRDLFRQLAEELQRPLFLLDFPLPEGELRCRVAQRINDVSEANLDVLEYQLAQQEPLTENELQTAFKVEPETVINTVIKQLSEAVDT
jgi:aminoglycoside phosphotransferase family enzyme/gluconate kinase